MAHIETKKYQGEDHEGHACSIEVRSISFLNNIRHPLNERIEVDLEGTKFILRHPETVNTTTGKITFDHDLLQGVVALPTGARSLTVVMSHDSGNDGPQKFIASMDDWKTKETSTMTCHLVK